MIKENQVTLQKNSVTHRKSDWSPLMTKCFVQILGEFDSRYQEWEHLHPRNLFGDDDYGMLCEYSFPADELTNETHGQNLATVKTALRKLREYGLTVKGKEDDPNKDHDWEEIGIIEYNKYDAQTKQFTVRLTHSICPYLVEAKRRGRFTMYNPFIAKQFEGKYTERFYEFMCQYQRKTDKDGKPIKSFFLMIDDMRDMFLLNANKEKGIKKDKYRDLSAFLKFIVEPSQKEMESLYNSGSCNMYFTYHKGEKFSTGGRPTVDRIWFDIHERMPVAKEVKKTPFGVSMHDAKTMEQKYLGLISVLNWVFNDEHGKNYLNLIKQPLANKMAFDRDLADTMINKIRGVQTDPNVHSKAAYVRALLEREWGIKPKKVGKEL